MEAAPRLRTSSRRTWTRPTLYVNRELSWLDFNERVLELAEDERTPLMERVKFLAIYSSNLDEFDMVRVAGLHDQVDAGIDARKADGLSPSETIERIAERRRELGGRHSRQWEHRCARRWPRRASGSWTATSCSPEELERLDRLFNEQIFPVLTPLAVGPGRPFPYISNLSLSLARVAARPGHRDRAVRAGEGAAGGAAAVRRPGRRHLRAAGVRDRSPPRRALPRHGGPAPRLLPGGPRRRLRGLRRGRRPDPCRREGAARAPLRRGRAARGSGGHGRRPARLPDRAAGNRGEPGGGRRRARWTWATCGRSTGSTASSTCARSRGRR